ncbi:unnamed protein product [Phyllotreta striolata]|uniref:ZZ-type domain-containing protein n=1 Tax=Phyllotreta striolata TaxID=444603 RepID=A0A9N9TJH0_PHYSR|nr:unnamed protein product [Phyllotreta striolata]
MMPSSSSPFNVDGDDCFFFESEHLALRGNKDYCEVVKSLVVLSAQREKLIKDYNKVVEIQKTVVDNPEILAKLAKGEDLGIELPPMFDLHKLPVINFDKYNVKLKQSDLDEIYTDVADDPEDWKKEQESVRRDNYQTWTAEEQKKLEELLIKHPPELIERRRFKKIASELGNRSLAQVTSRIQKYFLKLHKAGLPIPGRIPKTLEKKKPFSHKHQRYNHFLLKPTTFFPEFNTPVTMNELTEEAPGPFTNQPSTSTSTSSNYLMAVNYQYDAEIANKSKGELQLDLLKRIKEEKMKESDDYQHSGYKCDYCKCEPIIGSRWHCMLCPESVDYCTDCAVSQMYSNNAHPFTHPMAVSRGDERYNLGGGETRISPMANEESSNDSYGLELGDNEEENEEDSSGGANEDELGDNEEENEADSSGGANEDGSNE